VDAADIARCTALLVPLIKQAGLALPRRSPPFDELLEVLLRLQRPYVELWTLTESWREPANRHRAHRELARLASLAMRAMVDLGLDDFSERLSDEAGCDGD
jgi:hypothetical protein